MLTRPPHPRDTGLKRGSGTPEACRMGWAFQDRGRLLVSEAGERVGIVWSGG